MRFLPTCALEPGMIVGRDIVSSAYSIMLKKGVALTKDYIKHLADKGYLGVYIVDEYSMDINPEEAIPQDVLINGIKAVENCDVSKLMTSAKSIVASVSKMEHLSIEIVDLRSFDDYTFHHSVNVAVYAVAVGKYMGMSDDELNLLCQAGLCHDLGKQKISLSILNKPDRLTDEEYAEVKKHSQYSYDILYNNPEVPASVRQAVLCHHENENGSGYPKGVDGNKLSIMAKILHGADVYDALTSKRPYKDPYSPFEAFEYLIGGKNILFNEAVVNAMRQVIPTYPIGIEVGLSTGDKAIVIAQTDNPLRPVVRVIEPRCEMDLSKSWNEQVEIVASGFLTVDYASDIDVLNENRQTVKDKKPVVMIVDDSAVSVNQAIATLSRDKYDFIPLYSGIEVMEHINSKSVPDLLIMNVDLPIIDGITIAAKLRLKGYNELPIIFLTDKVNRETVLKCKSVNSKDYIIKPFNPIYFKERVAIALDEQEER